MPLGVILAAGRTQRINYLNTPKPLLLVHGKPLIVRQIDLLREAGIRDIAIVVGSSGADVRGAVSASYFDDVHIQYIENPDDHSSIMDSFGLISEFPVHSYIIASCDLVFEKNPFPALSGRSDIEVLVSKHSDKTRFSGAPIKVKTRFKRLLGMGRELDSHDALHAGIYFFTKQGLANFVEAARNASEGQEISEVLMRLHRTNPIKLSFLPDMEWFDINTPDMLLRAEMLMRRVHAVARPSAVRLETLQVLPATASFTYTKTQETKVILEPGVIKRLGKMRFMDPERVSSHHVIITDEQVDQILGDTVLFQLREAGYGITKLAIPAGEQSKSMTVYNDLAEKIIALGIDEQSVIFALGGGVVANVSGLLAATLYRGIGLVHLPTTIMNMLDVSISLKQGINGQKGKNLVGSYYQPLLVIVDPAISMPDWLVRDGLSEAIKHALCQDKDFYEYLLKNADRAADVAFRTEVIKRTIKLKIDLMHEDMFEHKRAMILQYGHEIGHAVEFLSRFELTHGQSIAIGMRVSAELAKLMKAGDDTVAAHKEILNGYHLPYQIPEYMNAHAVIDALKYNKKTRSGEVRFVLLELVGKAWKIKGEYGIPCPVELAYKAIEQSYAK